MPNFETAVRFVLKREGGYYPGDKPGDPNPTNMGVTQKTYDRVAPRLGLPAKHVKDLTVEEAKAIYKAEYWDGVVRDHHSDAYGLILFDTSVNFGPEQAKLWEELTDDPRCYLMIREAVYKWMARHSKPKQTWIKGWLNRINHLYKAAEIPREKPFTPFTR